MNSDKWCRHFNGIQYTYCRAEVKYADVRNEAERPYRLPCHGEQAVCSCEKYDPRTPEEIAETEREFQAALKHIDAFAEHESDTCPHCGQQVTALRQVGRCVYTSCGCRLWQGTVPKAWQP